MKLPKGRKIGDFNEVSPAEQQLLSCACEGIECKVGNGEIPFTRKDSPIIRAEIIRFLLNGGDENNPVHEKGVEIEGARITGNLDLTGCTNLKALVLTKCFLEGYIQALDADIQLLAIMGTVVDGVDSLGISVYGDRINVHGDMQIADGSIIAGAVYLGGAKIGGVLSFIGARVSHSLALSDNLALFADGADIKSDIFLSSGFIAYGQVRIFSCSTGGSIICVGGTFYPSIWNQTSSDSDALSLSYTKIARSLELDRAPAHENHAAQIYGGLNLKGVQVENLMDSTGSFPGYFDFNATRLTGNLTLDGFRYNNLLSLSPTDFEDRKRWLLMQPDKHLTENFKSQPFAQLSEVLNKMGNTRTSIRILILKEKLRARSGTMPLGRRIWHQVLGFLIGYGHSPQRLLFFGLLLWFAGCMIFGTAWRSGDMIPAHPFVAMRPEFRICREITHPSQNQLTFMRRIKEFSNYERCILGKSALNVFGDLSDYPRFNTVIYSLDVMLPVVDLHQENYWIPSAETTAGAIVLYIQWIYISIGWFLTGIGAASVTGLVKNS